MLGEVKWKVQALAAKHLLIEEGREGRIIFLCIHSGGWMYLWGIASNIGY